MTLPNLTQISDALDKIMPELTPVPVGTVAYAHEVPTGWLQCNGAAVSRTTYSRLFKKIGTKYGAGDGSTTFNLPDLQHRVLEGTNTTSEVAQKVEAGLPDITGSGEGWEQQLDIGTSGFSKLTGAFASKAGARRKSFVYIDDTANGALSWSFKASRSNATYSSPTVQPSALRLMPIIKA